MIVEDSLSMPSLKQLRLDIAIELRMALDRDKPVLDVHPLHIAERAAAQLFDGRWVVVDDVAVHLVDVLSQNQLPDMTLER